MAAAKFLTLCAVLAALCALTTPTEGAKTTISWKYGQRTPEGYSAVVRAGKRVFWKWADDNPHAVQGISANAVDEFMGNGTGNLIVKQKGFTYIHIFREPGLYVFNDAVYGNTMMGSIRVLPNPSGAYSTWFQPD